MSDITKQLAHEAFIASRLAWNPKWKPGNISDVLEREMEDVFDMIVKMTIHECANVVQDGTTKGAYYAMRIEEHFDGGPGGILQFKD